MVTKVVNIKVNDSDVKELTNDINRLDSSLENVEKQSKKTSTSIKDVGENGGAISTLDSITGGLATKIRDAAEASKLFNISLKGTRTALIATGIGAFVVALGLVVAYWEDIKDFISGSNIELERQLNITKRLGDEQQRELDILDKQDNILKLQGKTQKEINALKKQELEDVIEIRNQELALAKDRLQQLIDIRDGGGSALESFFRTSTGIITLFAQKVDELFSKIGIDTGFASASFGISDSILDKIFGTDEDVEQARQRVEDLENTVIDAQNRLAGIELEERGTREKERQTVLGVLTPEQQAEALEKKRQQFAELFDLEKMQKEELSQLGKSALEEAINNENILAAVQKKNDEEYLIRKKILAAQELQLTKNTLDNISSVLGKTSSAGKAVAIASALINTYQGISAELATKTVTPFEFGLKLANIATVTAIGFKSVKDIISTKLPNFANESSGSGASVGSSAPSFNVVGNSGVSQIAQTLNQEQQPIEAYVVASNVTSAQDLNRNIVETATLG